MTKIENTFIVSDFDSDWASFPDIQEAVDCAHDRWKKTLIGKDDTSLAQFVKVTRVQNVTGSDGAIRQFKSEVPWNHMHSSADLKKML